MNYSEDAASCRVDFFKPSGKWYSTEAVSFRGLFEDFPEEALKKALAAALWREGKTTPRYQGMTAVCLDPQVKMAYPVSMVVESDVLRPYRPDEAGP